MSGTLKNKLSSQAEPGILKNKLSSQAEPGILQGEFRRPKAEDLFEPQGYLGSACKEGLLNP